MKTELRPPALLLVGLGLVTSPLFAGCGGDDTFDTGSGATTPQGGGGTMSQGGGGTGGATPTGGGGAGGTATTGGGGAGGTGGTTGTTPTAGYDCSPAEGPVPTLTFTKIATGLDVPVLLRAAPGDDERLFIVEKKGRIRILAAGVLLDEPFLDITDRVRVSAEQGLLGLAFHPDYAQNGRFFVFYTDKNDDNGSTGDQNVAEYARSEDPDLAVAQADGFGQEVQNILRLFDQEDNQNGGALEFGPLDRFLYISLGDGGGRSDLHGPFGNGLDLGTLWGKIARIDVDAKEGGKNYAIPPGNMTTIPVNNPSTGQPMPEIWDYGLRNPWRFSFDPCSGDLYIGERGHGDWEEINVEPAGMGHRNYGWRAYEGAHVYDEALASQIGDVDVEPVVEYPHSAAAGYSVVGGYVSRSSAIPGLRGRYFYGDFATNRVWSFQWDPMSETQTIAEHTADLGPSGALMSFGQDNQGNVYLMDYMGVVTRIDAQ